MTFELFSHDLQEGARMPMAQVAHIMGHTGQNISPHLAWRAAPEGTRSFVVSVFDPDAPTGSGWWHWNVVNIPATVNELARGCGNGQAELPAGALQTRGDTGTSDYTGAAPPPGPAHRYIFTVHALGVDSLPLDAQASGAMVGFMVHMNRLASASLTVTYGIDSQT